ncbi:hypothetical protein MBLNU230_g5213t1 [Neophaeotheca triangularis]
MAPTRPPTSGYARIAQAEEEEEEQPYSDTDEIDPFHDNQRTLSLDYNDETSYAPIQPKPRQQRMHANSTATFASEAPTTASTSTSPRRPRRRRTNSGVDIKAINARLERWADEIKQRFHRRRVKGKSNEEEHLEIYSSVFQPPEGIKPATKEELERDDLQAATDVERLSKMEFDDIVESVRTAIELGMHPTLISQGSSGSYFARNTSGKILGVFKPKDEEPYASKNPKWTKWIHRNLFPFFFGRACLIPNLSYVSEAAAYVLDCQLRTGLVPYTDVVGLSSKSFYYDYWDRRAYYRKKKPLPEKLGSFQCFLKGYKGATEFFREHPWPDQHNSSFKGAPKRKKRRWAEECRPQRGGGDAGEEDTEVDSEDEERGLTAKERTKAKREFWSEELQQSFRLQLEKLVILDYIMRNTDRGTDNWMIRVDTATQQASIVTKPPDFDDDQQQQRQPNGYHRRHESMTTTPPPSTPSSSTPVPHIGAIDNSLSWPWKHPDQWRSYPFGWLFLPVTLIGRPFSPATKAHFLPLLTSKTWWSATQIRLREVFERDSDFKERMFARQMAVMKGQAWNVVETLKAEGLGPLELCRRSRVCVWDDLVDVPVAVPLQRPSEEMRRLAEAAARRQQSASGDDHEEMDISAAYYGSAPTTTTAMNPATATTTTANSSDLLNLSTTELNNNPFNSPRHETNTSITANPTHSSDYSPQQTSRNSLLYTNTPTRPDARRSRTVGQPAPATPSTRFSYDASFAQNREPASPNASPSINSGQRTRPRRFSLAGFRRGSGIHGPGFFSRSGYEEEEGDDGDDGGGEYGAGGGFEDGDLGIHAVGGGGRRQRKVIVERLEVLQTRGPVFSWC